MRFKPSRKVKSILVFTVLLGAWLIYVIWCFPGNVVWASGTSIAWYLNIDRSNNNLPYFQNLLMGSFYLLGRLIGSPVAGIGIYCLLQMLLELILLTKVIVSLSEMKTVGLPAFVPVILYALVPLFPVYAFSMAKDANFAIAILLFEYYAIQYANDKEAFLENKPRLIGLGVSVVLMALLRNHAGYLPAVAFLAVALLNRKRLAAIVSLATAAAVAVVCFLIPAIFSLPQLERQENMSLPLQMVAHYAQRLPDEVTEEEKATINSVIDYDQMLELYNPDIADPIKNISVFTPETQKNFLSMWLKMIWKQPGVMLRGFIKSTDVYYKPGAANRVKKAQATYGIAISNKLAETLGLKIEQPGLDNAKQAVKDAMKHPVFGIFSKIGIYSWILVIMALLTLIFKRLRRYFFCCVPLLMVFAGCLLSPVNGYYRYAYSMILSIPIVLIPILTETVRMISNRIRKKPATS